MLSYCLLTVSDRTFGLLESVCRQVSTLVSKTRLSNYEVLFQDFDVNITFPDAFGRNMVKLNDRTRIAVPWCVVTAVIVC